MAFVCVTKEGGERLMVPKLMTTSEVAEYLHCSTHHVGDLRRAGFIVGTRYGKYWLYTEKTISHFIENSEGFDLSNFNEMSQIGLETKYGDLLQVKKE